MNRIRALCMEPKAVGANASDTSGLLEEVSVDYLRTMNKIVLEAQTKEVRRTAVNMCMCYHNIKRRIDQAGGWCPLAK